MKVVEPDRVLRQAQQALLPVAALAAAAAAAVSGLGPGLLVLAGAALLGAVFLFWSSLDRLSGEAALSLDEALGLAAPSAPEERKRAVLRALKDLDYERSVGKISEEDHAELSARYRAEAKDLLRQLDRELAPLRAEAAERLARRLASAPGAAAGVAAPGPAAAGDRAPANGDGPAPPAPAAREAGVTCAACGVGNDADARFCKGCGAALAAPGAEGAP